MNWSKVRQALRGPGALVSTIFDDTFALRPEGITRNVRAMAERGFGKGGGFLISPCGDGEYVTLNADEIGQVVRAARQGCEDKLAIVAGVNAADLRQAINLAQAAQAEGAVAVMMSPPVYYTLNEDAIYDWYARFAARVDIGIMLYEQSFRGPAVNAGIRPDLVDAIFAKIREFSRRDLSVLMVEQKARQALEISDYAYVPDMGRNRFEGAGPALAAGPKKIDLYLGAGRLPDLEEVLPEGDLP